MSFIKRIFVEDVKQVGSWEPRPRTSNVTWPSESMAQLGSIPIGACKREVFYKILGETQTDPMTVRGQYICNAGLMYEDYHIEKFKKSGIHVDDQVKIGFTIPNSRHKIVTSGRMDVIIKDKDKKKSIEIKSISAYKAPAIMGNERTLALPATNNLMQAMLYKYYLTHTDEGKAMECDEVYLMYVNRSDASTFYYKVDLDPEGYAIITAINQTGQELYTMRLQDHPSFEQLMNRSGISTAQEGRIAELRVSMSDMFDKMDVVYDYATNKMLPTTDYKLVYSPEDIEREYKIGRMTKIKYNKACKGTAQYGDFRCAYCSFQKKCLSDSGINLK